MGKTQKHRMIRTIEESIDRFAGEAVRKKVMEDSDSITEKTDKSRIAEWAKDAMERLDALVDEETRVQIMETCGYKCADVHRSVIYRAKARRKKYKSVDEFLEAEQHNPPRGTRLVREGHALYQFYTPQTFGARCYCNILTKLPDEETISPTYCQCAKGFVKKVWETCLKDP